MMLNRLVRQSTVMSGRRIGCMGIVSSWPSVWEDGQRRGFAGHSKWANIKHRKGRMDAEKTKVNSKVSAEIQAAVKIGGPDPETNYRLDSAIRRAHKASVPNKVIEKAIALGQGTHEHGNLEHVLYEGSVHGALFIIEALTDKKTRTAPEIRHVFKKHEGHMEPNVAHFAFQKVGYLELHLNESEPVEQAMETAIGQAMTVNAIDFVEVPEEKLLKVYTDDTALESIAKELKQMGANISGDQVIYRPQMKKTVEDDATLETLFDVVSDLEDLQDVQHVFHNIEVDEHA